jgi:hypothetical protein
MIRKENYIHADALVNGDKKRIFVSVSVHSKGGPNGEPGSSKNTELDTYDARIRKPAQHLLSYQ